MNELGIPEIERTAFVLIDVQERLTPVLFDAETVIRNANILVKSAELMGIPLIVSEQYPKGLGPTSSRIPLPSGRRLVDKLTCSCYGCDDFVREMRAVNRSTLVLFGAETHVCILQTALDAKKLGLEVHVVADAVSSRTAENKALGLERLRQSGIFVVSTEMILFQLIKRAGTDLFKQVSALVK